MTSEGFKMIINVFGLPSLSALGPYFQISTGNPLLYFAHVLVLSKTELFIIPSPKQLTVHSSILCLDG